MPPTGTDQTASAIPAPPQTGAPSVPTPPPAPAAEGPSSYFRRHRIKLYGGIGIIAVIFALIYVMLSDWKTPSVPSLVPSPSASTQASSAQNHCSSYFRVCIPDAARAWKVIADGPNDFDLSDAGQGISLFLIYSQSMKFDSSDPGFASLVFLGQSTQAYKDTQNGLTRVITGINAASSTLIMILTSDSDISQVQAAAIAGLVKTQTQ